MSSAALLIKHLSQSGQVLRTITCPAGQVTVFRAVTPSDLKPFQRALAGAGGSERFAITLNNEPFNAHEHVLIGFGEQFRDERETVDAFVGNVGVPLDTLTSTLTAFGLDHVASFRCKDLPQAEARMLRLLAALHSTGRVVVLNDPFEAVPSQWRERYAELVAQFARKSDRIVVVTALSSRPESWIDNECIVRVQVGETRQKTIGFTSAPSEIRDEITQLREELLHRKQSQTSGPLTAVATTEAATKSVPMTSGKTLRTSPRATTEPESARNRIWRAITAPIPVSPITVTLVTVALGCFFSFKYLTHQQISVPESGGNGQELPVTTQENSTEAPIAVVPPLAHSVPPVAAVVENPSSTNTPEGIPSLTAPVIEAALLLDQYSPEIKQAVMHAYQNLGGANARNRQAEDDTQSAHDSVNRNSAEVLKMLEAASDTGGKSSEGTPTVPDYAPPAPPMGAETDQMSWEQRRELMRQRFLESIQAASQE